MEYRLASSALIQNFPPVSFVPGRQSPICILVAGCGGTHLNMVNPATVTIVAAPASIAAGASSTLTVTATNASAVTVTGSDGSSYQLSSTGGTQAVSPAKTTTYTATATGHPGMFRLLPP